MNIQHIHTDQVIGITDLKRGSSFMEHLDRPIAILKRDEVKAYLISPKMMDIFMELVEDEKLRKIAQERMDAAKLDPTRLVEVNINDL
jgi:PHD/YefM family antitoxin component YafN of YafNO toxin-antitoxin module